MTRPKSNPIPESTTEESKERKELKWRMLPTGLYCLFFEGGGELPAELTGLYTSVHKITEAIDNYKIKRGY